MQLLNFRLCAGHPHIVQLLEVYATPSDLAIVMEYANGGASHEHMVDAKEMCTCSWTHALAGASGTFVGIAVYGCCKDAFGSFPV